MSFCSTGQLQALAAASLTVGVLYRVKVDVELFDGDVTLTVDTLTQAEHTERARPSA